MDNGRRPWGLRRLNFVIRAGSINFFHRQDQQIFRLPTAAASISHRPESTGYLIFICKIFLVSTNWPASFIIINWMHLSTPRFSTSLKEKF
jgi:hypothetical protein